LIHVAKCFAIRTVDSRSVPRFAKPPASRVRECRAEA
jgi:hypothetical protein